jgi:hypothetical protein
MARQNGMLPSALTPVTGAALGDDASSSSTKRIFVAIERCTIVEFGAIATDSAHVPNSSFAFKLVKRTGGNSSNDIVVDAYTAANAAEAGPNGNTKLPNGIVTNSAARFVAGSALRAFCEVTLDKGDMAIVQVTTGGGASSVAALYVKAYPCGAGIVEANDVDSN